MKDYIITLDESDEQVLDVLRKAINSMKVKMKPGRRTTLSPGQRFGILTVVGQAKSVARPNGKGTRAKTICRCDCGNTIEVYSSNLKGGNTGSCGCTKVRHGQTKTITYKTWDNMIQRCTNPYHDSYQYYGARGITVCSRWRESFIAFMEDMGEKPEGLSIDRIDNEGNYEKDNCRWTTWSVQMKNRRKYKHKKTKYVDGVRLMKEDRLEDCND
jgi:hypothetical protein